MRIFNKLKKIVQEHSVNPKNSYMPVRCVSSELCGHRFTEMCKTCGNNIGPEPFKSCYVRKEG